MSVFPSHWTIYLRCPTVSQCTCVNTQYVGVSHVHLGMSQYLLGLGLAVVDISHIMQINENTESTWIAIEFSFCVQGSNYTHIQDILCINYKCLCILCLWGFCAITVKTAECVDILSEETNSNQSNSSHDIWDVASSLGYESPANI